jgi:hypothetical protein
MIMITFTGFKHTTLNIHVFGKLYAPFRGIETFKMKLNFSYLSSEETDVLPLDVFAESHLKQGQSHV